MSSNRAVRLWSWLAIFIAALAAYWPALSAGYVWDDDGHVTRPDLRSFHGLERIWFEVGATQQYYPVLHSAFWLEHRLWGDAAVGYHLLNVLLHATAACLFVLILRRLTEGRAGPAAPPVRTGGAAGPALPWPWLAGLLFVLHPVCVESVAWISEQKNTLSTVFYLLAALVYLRFDADADGSESRPYPQGTDPEGRDASPRRPRSGPYLVATLFFILALLTKSVTATLPAALLVALWWRNGSLAWRRDVVPLLPWFVLGIAAGLFTAWVEGTYIGATGARIELSAAQRVLLAGRVACFYLGKLVWPAKLVFVYPRWTVDPQRLWSYAYPIAALLVLFAAWRLRSRSRGLLAGLFFFVGSLVPALGFFNVYPFVFSYVADHFQYLASLGIVALAAGGWDGIRRRPALRVPGGVLALAAVMVLGALTWRQCRQYHDVETLFAATVDRNPSSWLAQENLGVALANRGRYADAISHYREALRLKPDYAETHSNYGNALAFQRRWPEAVAEYREALRLRPDFIPAAANWARAEDRWASELGNAGRLAEAAEHYREAIRLRPDYPEALSDLGLAESYSGRFPEAVAHLRKALGLRPGSAPTHAYLGLALAGLGRWPEAVAEYRESLRLNPRDRDVHYHLGLALQAEGEMAAAAEELAAANQTAP